jgi:hypothetical protein
MEFVKFRKLLNKNNIYLQDCYYRIIFHRYNNLNKIIGQTGGGYHSTDINKMSPSLLNHFVIALIDKNTQKIQWILGNN